MASVSRKVRVANPAKSKTRGKKPTAKNPLYIAGITNPRGTQHMAQPKKKAAASKPKRKKNPAPASSAARSSSSTKKLPRKRNPRSTGAMRQGGSLVVDGATVIMGSLVSRMFPQFILKAKNAGFIGYAANMAAALAAGWAVSRVMGKKAGTLTAIGGAGYLVQRVLTEQGTPIGQYLQGIGLGDATAATSLGVLQDSPGFFHPETWDAQGRPILPAAVTEAVRAMIPPPVTQKQMAGIGGDRYDARF